jgi:hypothetical protein
MMLFWVHETNITLESGNPFQKSSARIFLWEVLAEFRSAQIDEIFSDINCTHVGCFRPFWLEAHPNPSDIPTDTDCCHDKFNGQNIHVE